MVSKRRAWVWGLSAGVGALLVSVGCGDQFSTCKDTLSCENGGASPGEGGSSSSGGGSSGGSGGQSNACAEACSGDKPICDTGKKACVECSQATDCPGDKPVCAANSCQKCTSNADCGQVPDKGVCDVGSGACVQCLVEQGSTENESACGEFSCDPKKKSCTTTKRGELSVCVACVADSECQEHHRCVPMNFKETPREGGYCLKIGTSPGGCSRPYSPTIDARASLSGVPAAQYCGVNEDLTTCEGVRDLIASLDELKSCSGNDGCGVSGLEDAVCASVNTQPNRCSYSCNSNSECPSPLICAGPSGKYCGGPLL